MSCEEASKEYIEALNAKTRVEEELTPLMLSFIGTPAQPAEPTFPASEKVERAQRLMKEQDAAVQRFLAARDAFFEARKRHRG